MLTSVAPHVNEGCAANTVPPESLSDLRADGNIANVRRSFATPQKAGGKNLAKQIGSSGLSRRQWVQRLLGSAGAGLAWPGIAAAHPAHKHLADEATLATADAQAAAESWSPAFLDAHQNETVIVLAELIVPGASMAQSNRFIDLALTADSQENKEKFVHALSAFEGVALERFGRPFKDLTGEQQTQILTEASTQAAHERHGFRNRSGNSSKKQPAEATLRDHFENLKGWVVAAYYSSEVGMRELGWNGDHAFESFPGCQHPEGHS